MADEMSINSSLDPEIEGKVFLAIAGALTITGAGDLRQALLAALEKGEEIRVDLSRATEVDLTALQLLWSARQSAKRAGKQVVCAASSAACLRVAEAAGFECVCVEQST